jgi:hypothetical protein
MAVADLNVRILLAVGVVIVAARAVAIVGEAPLIRR